MNGIRAGARRTDSMKPIMDLTLLIAFLGLSACSGMKTTEQRVLSGAAIGAGVGAVGTVITGGCVACGTALGGAIGASAGYLVNLTEVDN